MAPSLNLRESTEWTLEPAAISDQLPRCRTQDSEAPDREAPGHDVSVTMANPRAGSSYRVCRRHHPQRQRWSSSKPTRSAARSPATLEYCDSHKVNRYYDPASYQFLSIDPRVGTTLQPYAFVGGDPLNATDPLGELSQEQCRALGRDISRMKRKVQRRYRQMQRDVRGEFGPNPPSSGTTAAGHLRAYENDQRGLRNRLNEWSNGGCGGGGTRAPSNAYSWAYRPAPRSAPSGIGPLAFVAPGAVAFAWLGTHIASGVSAWAKILTPPSSQRDPILPLPELPPIPIIP
jgi:hypothetical protein